VAEHQPLLDAIHVGRMHRGGATKVAAALGAFGLAQVPPAGTGTHDFPAGRNLEPLGRGFLGLDAFWTSHKLFSCLSKRARNICGGANRIKPYFGLFAIRQGKFMKESYPRKWVLEPRRPQADGFCIFAGARFLAAVKCRIRFSVGWFWAAQSLVWT